MPYFFAFFIAFLLCYVFTQITIRLAFKYGFVDNPARKHGAIIHSNIVPRAGGVPVYLATLLTVLLFANFFFSIGANIKNLIGIFFAGILVVVLGTIDDKYEVSPKVRLLFMFVFALLVVGFGIGVNFISNPLGGVFRLDLITLNFDFNNSIHKIVILADIVALVWIVSMMNIVNWSSGLDGQNAGISVIAFMVLGFASLRSGNVSESSALLSFILSGAYFGFLMFSRYPQKIMPGFGGSTFSGFMIAVISIMSGVKIATAVIVLAIPILDAGWVFVRRLWRKQNPMKNDRTHLHHYLLDIGWSKQRIAIFYWIISAVLGILVLQANSLMKIYAFVIIFFLFIFGVLWLQRTLRSSKH
ncbi:MAG: undecaprenyl/decaprenyl-phosphate alpha-N-acetylglucosaminyl 1-phosphate transferase [bacterium]|nr:undecaprenyl/decaprenyl-phosphate alpha-N-acetylglucosaminyl 1-phosphate transferase [bacterium]